MHKLMKRRMQGERGASLVIALVFLAVFGLLTTALLGFGDSSIRASQAFRNKRTVSYDTDGALDAAINRVRIGDTESTPMGRDPVAYPSDACNPSGTNPVITIPASGTTPAMVASCSTPANSGSGLHADLGAVPDNAILTLGDKRTAGATTSLGVRNNEAAPYSGTQNSGNFFDWFNWYSCRRNPNTQRMEFGIRFDNTRVCNNNLQTAVVNAWNVRGNIFSNSRVVVSDPGGWPKMINPPTGTAGTIKARGGCSGFACDDAGWDMGDGQGADPNYKPNYQTADNKVPTLPNGAALPLVLPATGNAAWIASKVAQCSVGIGLVTFTPGIYRDASAINSVFGNAACKNATFWFKPYDPGTPTDTTDDIAGSYYFDFTNTFLTGQSSSYYDANGFHYCGNSNSGISRDDMTHQWCIGGRGSDWGGQRVIGGTPYGWDPSATPTNRDVTMNPTNYGNRVGFWWFFRNSPFTNPANALTFDNATSDLVMSSGRTGGSITLGDYRPQAPRGSVDGVDLEIRHAATYNTTNHRLNQPTVTIYFNNRYGFFRGQNRCGPYTLPKPPIDGSLSTVLLSTVNPAAAADLKTCLNSGDRINSSVVQYNVSRPGGDGGGSGTPPTAKLDGIKMHVTVHDGPSFPRPPSATDNGGDCDVTKAGVQFIFGGDSHVFVPNGGMELCAGPNPTDAAHGIQIALYEPGATPRLQPTTIFGTNANDGVDNPDAALSIAEGAGVQAANIKYHYVCPVSRCSDAYEGSMTLRFPGYAPPAGYDIGKVELRTTYNSANPDSSTRQNPRYELSGLPGTCGAQADADAGTGMRTMTRDVTSCLTANNRIGSALNVVWHARRQCNVGVCPASAGTQIDQLDGMELVVTLNPTDPNANLRPASGCITASPNYWEGTGNPDCAVLKVEGAYTGSFFFFNRLGQQVRSRGRVSIKGTTYVPSGAVDIDDTDVYYPLFSRGLIARHLRLKAFKYHQDVNAAGVCQTGVTGQFCYSEPAFNNWLDPTQSDRTVQFYVCKKATGPCTATDLTLQGRASVTYAAKTNVPTVQIFSLKHD